MQQQPYNKLPGKQSGATLVVALIMLLLISLLGASSLKNALLTERMAGAGLQYNITFQASESAAAIASDDTSQIVDEVILTNAPVVDRVVDIDSTVANAKVSAEPLGTGNILGTSVGAVTAFRVMITSTAELNDNPSSKTVVVHGITRIGAAF